MTPAIPPGFWDRYAPRYRPAHPPIPLGNAGGLSGSHFWRVGSAVGPLMLRAWPTNGPPPAHLAQVHRWLGQIQQITRLPRPHLDLWNRSFQNMADRLWELTPFLSGRADLDRPPSPVHLEAMFAALAAIHSDLAAEAVDGRSPGLEVRANEMSGLLAGDLARFDETIRNHDDESLKSSASDWLSQARAIVPGLVLPLRLAAGRMLRLQPVLRDVRPDHFLFEADQLSGLVDFGAMGLDAIATDLARLLSEAVGSAAEQRLVALRAYEAIRPLTPGDLTLIRDFQAANAVLGGARWVRWGLIERRRFDDPAAVHDGLARALRRLAEWRSSLL